MSLYCESPVSLFQTLTIVSRGSYKILCVAALHVLLSSARDYLKDMLTRSFVIIYDNYVS